MRAPLVEGPAGGRYYVLCERGQTEILPRLVKEKNEPEGLRGRSRSGACPNRSADLLRTQFSF